MHRLIYSFSIKIKENKFIASNQVLTVMEDQNLVSSESVQDGL
ncbi:MAG: hypothetical protein H6Q14_2963 [Bacteroidetes bacterium]|nr:hypothetical protein [Bacteroidota bacterium]